MLRTVTFASAAALGLASLGLAAPALAQSADAWTWTGPYVGVNLGYGGGDFKYPFSGTTDAAGANRVTGRARQSSSGVLGGGQVGYNFQMPNGVVLGLETDIDAADIGGNSSFSSATASGTNTTSGVSSRINYLGTVRGRVGKPMFDGRFMPYVTGGFAYGGVRNNANFNGGGFATNTQTQTGWTAGAGAEYALNRHLSFKVEYLYVDLGSQNLTGPGATFNAPGVPLYNASLREQTNANVVRAGLNYRF
ncbi:MAG: porin family protein [Caulobacteraceae bacterium]|jgi:outer membrane immunogenic protein|nr:porin family protein [Caulobacteraceae bacterium]